MAFTNFTFWKPEEPDEAKVRLARLAQDTAAHAAEAAAQASRRSYGPDLVAYNEGVADETMTALDPLQSKYLSPGQFVWIRDELIAILNNSTRPLAQQTELYQNRVRGEMIKFARAMMEELLPKTPGLSAEFRAALLLTNSTIKPAEEAVDPAADVLAHKEAFSRRHYTGEERHAVVAKIKLQGPGARLAPHMIHADKWGWRDVKGHDHVESRFDLRDVERPINTPEQAWLKGFPTAAEISKWTAQEAKEHLHEDVGDANDPFLDDNQVNDHERGDWPGVGAGRRPGKEPWEF